jgi:hypothetical protein
MNEVTLRSFYPTWCIDNMTLEILENQYEHLKNRIASGYVLSYDTLLLEALKQAINERKPK